MRERHVRRLALAGVLLAAVGTSRGLDTAVTVALCLMAMEVDAQSA